MSIVEFLINQIFREPALFLGIIALFGLVLQRKAVSDILKGTLKTVVGVVILTQGTSILVNSIIPLSNAFNVLYKIAGDAEFKPLGAEKFLAAHGSEIGLAMVLAFAINLLVARLTPLKNVFLTGHMLFWFPFIFVASAVELGLQSTGIVVFATIFTALYIIITPALIRPFVKEVIGDDSFTLGHPTVGLSLVAGYLGKWFGDKQHSTEDIKIPKQLDFLKEITITSSLVMFVVYICIGWLIGGEQAAKVFSPSKNIFVYATLQGAMFGAGLTILLTGVRMMLAEIIPAFKGISDKIIPNAVPALDCPIIFPYAPNAVLIGFVVSMLTSVIALLVLGQAGVFHYAVLPLTITCFFEIGTAAVIGNGTGGKKGAVLGAGVAGVLMILLAGFSIPFFKGTVADWIIIFGGNDFSLWGMLAQVIGRML